MLQKEPNESLKHYLYRELISITQTFFAVFAVEAGIYLLAIYQGDFSEQIFVALASALLRSIVKVIIQEAFPKVIK